ncbi:MAG: LysR family transcriptional regulator [Burkholderiales bacterium]|nr:LysR family transcriptional regulator [Burkholderiales bacterium]
MDRFEAMRAYVYVVDSGSYTKAAQQLSLHKATVSQQIQQLERLLGARLLTRTTRFVTPTPEGLDYHRHACAILQQLDDAESRLRQGASAPAGPLRVNVPVALGHRVFVPEVRGFLERHPKVSLELSCSDRAVDLVQEGVDCAVRGGELADSSLVARRVGDLRFVLCAAPRYIDERGLPETPQDLARHQQIGFVLASSGKLRPVRLLQAGAAVDVGVPARFVTTDSAAALSAGLDGLGLVVLAEFVAAHHLASGALVRVLPRWHSPSLPLHLVTTSRHKRMARVQVFMDWARGLMLWRLGSHIEGT